MGGPINSIDQQKAVTEWHIRPDRGSQGYNDIALGTLDSPLGDVSPMPLNVDPVEDSRLGTALTYLGYGATDDSGTTRCAEISVYSYHQHLIDGLGVEENQNVCCGDSSGSPLRHRAGVRYAIIGCVDTVIDLVSQPATDLTTTVPDTADDLSDTGAGEQEVTPLCKRRPGRHWAVPMRRRGLPPHRVIRPAVLGLACRRGQCV